MFGHDNHDNDNDDNAHGAPMPPDPVPSNSPSSETPTSASPDPTPPVDDVSSQADSLMPTPPTSDTAPNDDLLDIKQQALQQLTPLVGHLDQTPEEKFRTTMMMIQGADNQDLIKDAYAAAQQITDEKARAQALLDIVNEINYFTQHSAS